MLRLSTLIFLLLISINGHAQIIKRYKRYPAPAIVLVKLPTYANRLHTYEKAKNVKYAEQLKKDAANIQRLMIADFNNNFGFCDYYFFYDTVNNAIAERHFAGNLYDKDMNLVTSSPIADDDTTYQIVHYGYYVSELTEVTSNPRKLKSKENTYFTGTSKQRLIVLNYKFGRLPDPLPNGTFYSKSPTLYPSKSKKKRIRVASYTSPKLDLYYTPLVANLNYEMERYYNEHRLN